MIGSYSQDIPQLEILRQNTIVQAQVEKWLRELSVVDKSGLKQKSLRGGPIEVIVPHRVKWPHGYILSGSNKEWVPYDHFSITQWMAGFCSFMRDEKNSTYLTGMLDYLISLLDDANNFSWDAAKASHAVLICWIEQSEIKDYTQTDKIDQIRRANAQRHLPYANNCQQHSKLMRHVVLFTSINVPCVLQLEETIFSSGKSIKKSFLPGKKNTDGAVTMTNEKQSLVGNKNKIGLFDGVGNILSVQHDQEYINSIECGVACHVNFLIVIRICKTSIVHLVWHGIYQIMYCMIGTNVRTLGRAFNKTVTLLALYH